MGIARCAVDASRPVVFWAIHFTADSIQSPPPGQRGDDLAHTVLQPSGAPILRFGSLADDLCERSDQFLHAIVLTAGSDALVYVEEDRQALVS